MQITAMPSELVDVLNKVLPAVGKTEITTCVRLCVENSVLTASCSDGEISLTTSYHLNDCEDGDICVIAKTFVDTLKKLKPDVMVKIKTLENNRVSICSGKFRNYLQYLESDMFPIVVNENSISSVTFKTQQLYSLLDGVKFCVSQDSYRAFLKGGSFTFGNDGVDVVTSNGHMMAYCGTSAGVSSDLDPIIIPKRSLDVIATLTKSCEDDTVIMRVAKNSISMVIGDICFNSVLISATFPDVTPMINFNSNIRVVLDREEFIESMKRVSITSNTLNKAVAFTLSGNTVSLSSKNSKQEEAVDEMTTIRVVNTSGREEFSTAFNSEYMMNVLSRIDTPKFCFNASTQGNNVRVTSCNSDDCLSTDNSIPSVNDDEYIFLISKVII